MGFFSTILGQIILRALETLAVLVPLLIIVAYATYGERRMLGAMQLRKRTERRRSLRSLAAFRRRAQDDDEGDDRAERARIASCSAWRRC